MHFELRIIYLQLLINKNDRRIKHYRRGKRELAK